MVDFTPSERHRVNSLHGTSSFAGPSNYRDASNSGPWKNPPTPICIPSHPRDAGRRGVASPYNQMSSTFRNSIAPQPGNPIARATLLTTQHKAQDSKRSKLNLSFPPSVTKTIVSPHRTRDAFPSLRDARHSAANALDAEAQVDSRPRGIESTLKHYISPGESEVVEISDEEDLGVAVPRPCPRPRTLSSSPDPLHLHAFETHPGHFQHADPRKGKGMDIALKPQTVTAVTSDIEEIEEFTSEPANDCPVASRPPRSQPAAKISTPCIRSIKRGSVAEKREGYEPNLDLRKVHALKGRTGGVTKKMKGKGTKPTSSKLQLDYTATSSTAFTSASLSRTRESLLKLPLKAWAIGLKVFSAEEGSDSPVFEYDPRSGRLDVSVPGQSRSYRFQPPNGFEDIKFTNDSDRSLTEAVVQLYTKNDCSFDADGLLPLEFTPGSKRMSGCLTFLFSPGEVKGWNTIYQKLISLLTKSASSHSSLRPVGGKSLWEEVRRHAEMYQESVSRSSDSSHKLIAPQTNDVPSPPVPHHSRANSQTHLESNPKSSNIEAGPSVFPRRASRRLAAAAIETQPESPPLADPEELILVYPPSGPGALNIMGSDLNRLNPHEFLNDTLIEFGLKLWLTELGEQDPDLANQIHVFSSFFYKKLNNKKSLDQGYQSVKKWTSRVDVFSKKYIVVPINENLHWYLAIIYEPEHTLQPPLPQKEQSLSQRGKLRRKNAAQPDIHLETENEPQQTRDIQPMEEPSDPDVEMASLNATRASTPSIAQDEGMSDIPIEFSQSCSISDTPLERPDSAPSSKPESVQSTSASVGKVSGRSISVGAGSIELIIPSHPSRLDAMDVDVTIIDVEADREVTQLSGGLISSNASTSAQVSDPSNTKLLSHESGVPPTRFYGSSTGKRGKQKADEPLIVPDSEVENDDDDEKKEVDAMLGGVPPNKTAHVINDPPRTRIFTLDSLGSRHLQAVNVLKYWLKAEAKDKRNIEDVRVAEGKFVQVPSQPNFADCGIYLLHFAKTFLSRPAHYFDLIYQTRKITADQRREDWDEDVVQYFREDLIRRITQLSEEWKVSRAAREEDAKRKRKSEELGQNQSVESDAEVDIVEDLTVPRTSPKRPAKRIRG